MQSDPNSPKTLAIVRTEAEAVMIVNLLQEFGVQALIAGAGTSTGWPEANGDVQIVVREVDLPRAQELLDSERQNRVPSGPA